MEHTMNLIKKYLSQYVNSKGVLAVDIAISIISSFTVLLLLNFLTNAEYDSFTFVHAWMASSVIGSILSMLLFKSYRVIIRHSSLRDYEGMLGESIVKCALMAVSVFFVLDRQFTRFIVVALIGDLFMTFVLLVIVRMMLLLVYDHFKSQTDVIPNRRRVLLYGMSDSSISALANLQGSDNYRIVGIIPDRRLTGVHRVNDVTVYPVNSRQVFDELVSTLSVQAVMFASEADVHSQENGIIAYCISKHLGTLIYSAVGEVKGGKSASSSVRTVSIEDLLGRDEIVISMDGIKEYFKDKTVLVTGAAGSIGLELCRQLAHFDVRKIVLFDNAETPMHTARLELEASFPNVRFAPVVGDVRSGNRLDYVFSEHRPDVVFHAAAYKHVPLMEENPCEAVNVNVGGTRIVADKCIEYGVGKMIMISTDKAVNPTNIMGCTKRLAEIYVQSLATAIVNGSLQGKTQFVTTRFGNVLGSNGSVIPRFREQIEKGGPVTVTHPDINRFFMTIPEACRLVMEAATMGIHNRIFVFDMGQPVKIVDLAKRMIELSGYKPNVDIDIEYTGLRPGEKLYEEVLATAENTDSTSHDRIRIAHVREDYDYDSMVQSVDRLLDYSKAVNVYEMVKYMKQLVPEFKSQNSRFVELDK